MFRNNWFKLVITIALLLGSMQGTGIAANAASLDDTASNPGRAPGDLSPNISVFASGLNNPRGLKFGPDGALYVAEGGIGGTNSAVGQCDQVPGPVGPYTGSKTGARISKIGADGKRTTVAENFPSSQTTQQGGSFVSGVADIAFVGNIMYAVLSGAGCSHGVPEVANALVKVNADGTWTQVADLSAFLKANPIAKPDPDDFEPDGTWYGLLAMGNDLYVTEPNHQELDEITTDGKISRVIDLSTQFAPPNNWLGPTEIALGSDGNFYIGSLGTFPAGPKSKILKITPNGQTSVWAQGLTTAMGVAFDGQGKLYALEASGPVTKQGPPVIPGTGRVVRISDSGALEPVTTGLTFPTAMTFGPDGKLYVSNFGFGFPAGKGEIVRVDTSVPVPTTLPVTGSGTDGSAGAGLALFAGLALVLASWLLRRRIAQ